MEIKINFLDKLRLEAKFDDFTVVADQPRQAAPRLAPQSAKTPAEWKPEKPTATGFTFNRTPKKEDLL